MSTTYSPKNKKRKKTHGFRARANSISGKKIIKKRRAKNRKRLTH
jgi:large subunit ribosomal protein L34